MKVSQACVERLKGMSMIRRVQEPLRCENDRFEYELFDLDLFTENVLTECVGVIHQSISEETARLLTLKIAEHFSQAHTAVPSAYEVI